MSRSPPASPSPAGAFSCCGMHSCQQVASPGPDPRILPTENQILKNKTCCNNLLIGHYEHTLNGYNVRLTLAHLRFSHTCVFANLFLLADTLLQPRNSIESLGHLENSEAMSNIEENTIMGTQQMRRDDQYTCQKAILATKLMSSLKAA